MKSKTAFTKTDVVVVLGCVMFFLTSLGAIGRAGRSRAKEAVCKANLRQWGLAFSLYAADYDGLNPYGGWAHSWWWQMLPYIQPDSERNLFFCPMATKESDPQPFKAWNYGHAPLKYGGGRWTGSYGVNPWIFSFEGRRYSGIVRQRETPDEKATYRLSSGIRVAIQEEGVLACGVWTGTTAR